MNDLKCIAMKQLQNHILEIGVNLQRVSKKAEPLSQEHHKAAMQRAIDENRKSLHICDTILGDKK